MITDSPKDKMIIVVCDHFLTYDAIMRESEVRNRLITVVQPETVRKVVSTIRGDQWYRIDGDDGLPFLMKLGTDASGRLVCTGLLFGVEAAAAEITMRSLRAIRLGEVLAGWADWRAFNAKHGGSDPAASAIPRNARPARPKANSLDDDAYQRAAAFYLAALEDPDDKRPIATVAAAIYASEPTVRRHLTEARRRGFIHESVPGPGSHQRAGRPKRAQN